KVADKMGAIENLLGKVDTILIGGAMAYTFLVSLGEDVGSSLVEKNRVLDAKKMLEQAKKSTTTIMLPTDHVCAKQIGGRVETTTMHTPIPQGLMGLDIGPETIKTYSGVLKKAKTIVWNGPMGVFEVSPYDEGTKRMATAVSEATEQGAVSIVGGGDTAAAVSLFELESKMTHLSTGGGASLQMLEGKAFSSVALLDDAL
ncbi:MAG: phosphoglycerate kinase, partial [Phycisphaerae bacterium]|nr:phosphoglycerate kinase [Phycisphaerae bacterium]